MNPVTIDDIYELFRESERQRQDQQQAFEQRQQDQQRAFEQRQQDQQRAFEHQQRAFEQRQQDQQQAFEHQRQAFEHQRQAFEQRQQAIQEQQRLDLENYRKQSEDLQKIVAQTNKQVGAITSRWGEFVENLVRPAAVRMFRQKGIEVHFTALRVQGQDQNGSIEIDVLAENSNEVVIVEVKSHLEAKDVKRFLVTLERFKRVFPKYQNYRVYGAVAGIKVDERADLYALQEGLFLIKPSGDTVEIVNSSEFIPKVW